MAFGLLAALAPAAVGLLGSVISSKASKKAAKQQVAANREATNTMTQYLGPYADAGTAGLSDAQKFISEGARYSDTQAYKDITNSAKASGMNLSGNRLTALSDYYATNFRPQRLNELLALPRIGAAASGDLAAGIGGLQQNSGDARAAGTIGSANAFAGGLGVLGSDSFLNLLNRNNLGTNTTSPLSAASQFPFSGAPPPQDFGTFTTGIGPFDG